ncbi:MULTISPECIES: hypothetical protein [Bacillus]|uniref:Uncharacterized protein n=2 Tax=Bacillus TaxID=1386 RepID=A0A0M4FRS0_9BACI|nr:MULTISPECIES: hypothetical protein [Bacillus]ALC82121.1 hypothetical protein AM592_11375 [Bacillus gobiensis]MBP1084241.1 hypothetical protein [Bacillus capparidis]MED1095633.1 hypothetical protein [Bacillus capparidis]
MTYTAPQVDYSVMRPAIMDQAWFLVFIAVLLGLGATVVLGAAVWCIYNGHGSFTGSVQWVNGLKVSIECI